MGNNESLYDCKNGKHCWHIYINPHSIVPRRKIAMQCCGCNAISIKTKAEADAIFIHDGIKAPLPFVPPPGWIEARQAAGLSIK